MIYFLSAVYNRTIEDCRPRFDDITILKKRKFNQKWDDLGSLYSAFKKMQMINDDQYTD